MNSYAPYPNQEYTTALNNPRSSVKNILSSTFFLSYWLKSDPSLLSFIIQHCDELIEIGFQINSQSPLSTRCIQVMCSGNFEFRKSLYAETNLSHFLYDYLFKIDTYSFYSQKSYFYALPNFMVDQLSKLNPIFDQKYFSYLFNHIENEFIYDFVVRLIKLSPMSVAKAIKKAEIEEIVISNYYQNLITPNSPVLLFRYQSLLKNIINSKFSGNSCPLLLTKIDEIVKKAIENPNTKTFSFLEFLDNYSVNKFYLSKWKNIHLKIVPYLSSFCEIALNENSDKFDDLAHSCTLLSISITASSKTASNSFIDLFKRLSSLFFILKTNTFLHNCFLKAFNVLLSLGQITSQFLDEINLFEKVLNCYENREVEYMVSYFGQLRIISEAITKFAVYSNTIDIEKWNRIVVEKNQSDENMIGKKYGGFVPLNINAISVSLFDFLSPPSFTKGKLYLPMPS